MAPCRSRVGGSGSTLTRDDAALELSLTGNFLGADDAMRHGLVNHVVPHDELVPFARHLAETWAPGTAMAGERMGAVMARGREQTS